MKRWTFLVGTVGFAIALGGCQQRIPRNALAMTAESLEKRQLQTRKFSTSDESKLLTAAVGLTQDLGFTIESTQSKLGLITGSKQRDATDGGQVAGAIFVALLTGVATPVDQDQTIRLSIVTFPAGNQTALRATFQRMVRNTHGQTTRLELIQDPEIYQQFFEKLSKAVFLEAQKI